MSKILYVGNLTDRINEGHLRDLFGRFGTILSARIVTDRYDDRSKGFGFVEMSAETEAQAALEALDDSEYDGRRLMVNETKPRPDRRSDEGYEGVSRSDGDGGGLQARTVSPLHRRITMRRDRP